MWKGNNLNATYAQKKNRQKIYGRLKNIEIFLHDFYNLPTLQKILKFVEISRTRFSLQIFVHKEKRQASYSACF